MHRKKKYPKPIDLENKINEYFDSKSPDDVMSLGGLCCHLDLTYEGFAEYGRRKSYSAIVKSARQKIETWLNEAGMSGKIVPTMSMFNLKCNFKWNDKAGEQSENTDDAKPVKIVIQVEDAS